MTLLRVQHRPILDLRAHAALWVRHPCIDDANIAVHRAVLRAGCTVRAMCIFFLQIMIPNICLHSGAGMETGIVILECQLPCQLIPLVKECGIQIMVALHVR